MFTKGDARAEAPSSDGSPFARGRAFCEQYAGRGLAGFVSFHLACQAFRAFYDRALPTAGFESEPAFVLGVLLVIFVPFCVFSWAELRRPVRAFGPDLTEKARALAVLERVTHWLVLLFLGLHLTQVAWPLLDGERAPDDVRPELVALLSSTDFGTPLIAAAYLCGVGAACFLGARHVLRALGPEPSRAARGAVLCGVLACVLGSYAVIRCAGGAFLR